MAVTQQEGSNGYTTIEETPLGLIASSARIFRRHADLQLPTSSDGDHRRDLLLCGLRLPVPLRLVYMHRSTIVANAQSTLDMVSPQ